MKLNSPTWDSAAPTATAVDIGLPSRRTTNIAAIGLPSKTTASTIAINSGARTTLLGSHSIPTETKKSTAKASRMGKASFAARAANSERPTASPARKAPSAIDTPKSLAAPIAIPSATTRIESVKSSRERAAAMCSSAQGITHLPSSTTRATSAMILSAA
jgi:hypothetical protein